MIGVDENVRGGEEETVGVEDADGNGMLGAIAEQAGEGCEVNAVGLEVEGLDAGDGLPQKGVDAAGEDPWEDGSNAGGFAVDADFGFAEGGVATGFEFAGNRSGDAQIPELVADLALGDDVEVDLLDVAREVEGGGGLVGGGVEGYGAVAGAYGNDDVWRDGCGGVEVRWVELE